MVKVKRNISASFKAALAGLIYAFCNQPNLRRGLLFALLALILSFVFHLSRVEFSLIVGSIFIFFIAEMVNTSLEAVVDLLSEEWNVEAKTAKDIASGMVLLTAIGTIVVGILVFTPYIIDLLGNFI